MDWDFAIERNRSLLLGIVMGLFAMIGLAEGTMVERLSRPVYRKALRILRSAESATRRLIIASARDIVVEPRPKRSVSVERKKSGESKVEGNAEGTAKAKRRRGFFFRLFDRPRRKDWGILRRRKNTRKVEPRIRVLGDPPDTRHPIFRGLRQPEPPPTPPPPVVEGKVIVDDGTVNAIRLCRRVLALMGALEDIPRQALRYARLRDKPKDESRPQSASPLRLGWPPGWRIKSTHEVDDILKECHWIVREAKPALDTS